MKWKRYIPYIDVWVNFGVLQIKTDIMNERLETMTREYFVLRVTLFFKYGFSIRLYSPRSQYLLK
jgi:hypothetical protein